MVAQPRPRKILYVAPLQPGDTSLYRYQAFERIGQQMVPFALDTFQPKSRYIKAIRDRYPVGPMITAVNRALVAAIEQHRPDVVWFDKPLHIDAESIAAARQSGAATVCYNQDNPFGPRNDNCWMQFRKVYKLFDLHCLFRTIDIPRYRAWGLRFIKISLSYDPRQHFPPPAGWSDANRTREVGYTGSPLEDRPKFLEALAEQYGVPISVAGPRWEKAWPPELQAKYVVGGMMKDAAYRESIWKSKVNLAFVTELNEEDVAHKSFEITACAQFLLAKRSFGHQETFEEGMEAEFYGSLEECADKAKYYLSHPRQREEIAAAGRVRSMRSGYDNDSQLARVLWKLDGVDL